VWPTREVPTGWATGGSGVLGFCLRGRGDSELFHHRHEVPVGPLFHDPRSFELIDGGAGDGGLAVGGVHAKEVAFVGSVGGPVDDDLVALGDRVVDGESEIGKGLAAVLDVVPDVLRSRGEVWEDRIVKAAIVGDEVGDSVELSVIPALFHKAVDDLLVFDWRFILTL
jgi:hypothetical protein